MANEMSTVTEAASSQSPRKKTLTVDLCATRAVIQDFNLHGDAV